MKPREHIYKNIQFKGPYLNNSFSLSVKLELDGITKRN